MKVKEIDRTANIVWSPAIHHPIYLAAGTAAQQLDATFSTTAALEIYALNLTEPGLDMCMKGSVVSDYRFHKLVWGCEGMKTSEMSSGVLVGGADGGNIMMYDAAKLIQGDSALLHQNSKHTGPVHSLDFNKFQDCLLASGASESEIYIWDLNNPSAPVTLGAKSQPPEDVTCVAWNCQVQHILASTFPARCVVWDLRKNEPIIKVSDSSARLRCKVVCWHPEVATQLCLASEDDHNPVIQLWDLRFATSPLKTLEHHTRGVLSIAWCPQDPDLLLSCGKDNRILCWNPNSNVENGEVLCELPAGSQWSFDIAWCPRNPAVIANSSCDGHVGVFSLMGGQQQAQCSSKIAESFPGSDTMSQPPNVESIHRHISVPLQKPPKWVRKPVGASFGFGGKLVYFKNIAPNVNAPAEYVATRHVHITQVITEPELLKKSEKLESSLSNGNLIEFCQNKIDSSEDEYEKITWNFLQATFDSAPRTQMLSLLGYSYETVMSEINSTLKSNVLDERNFNEEFANLSTSEIAGDFAFDNIAMKTRDTEEPLLIQTDAGDIDGLLSQALLTGNISSAVEICIQKGQWADALVLAQAGGSEILQKTQRLYFKSINTSTSKLISAVVTSDWLSMVKNCSLSCWKEILAAILTYAKPEDFSSLCEILGSRLENDAKLQSNAALCYISAGNLEQLAKSWIKLHNNLEVVSLQNLIEQVMVLRRAVEQLSGTAPPLETGILSSLLGQYAELLATQGSLTSAVTYLVDPNERTLAILRDRIYQSLGHRSPLFPFQRVDVHSSGNRSQTPQQPMSYQDRRRSSTQYSYGNAPQPFASTAQPFQSTAQPFSSSNQPFSNAAQPFSNTNQPFASTTQQFSSTNQPFASTAQSFASTAQQPYASTAQPFSSAYTYPSTTTPQYQPSYNQVSPPGNMPPVAPASVPPPADSPQQSSKSRQNSGGPHHLSQRYPRHLHDPSVYTENTFSTSQPYFQQGGAFPSSQTSAFPAQPMQNFYAPPDNNATGNFSYAPASNVGPSYPQAYSSGPPPVNTPPPQLPPTPLPSCYSDVKPGWNDPPMLKKQSIQATPLNYEAPTPITRPFPDMPAVEPPVPVMPQSPPGGYFTPNIPQQTSGTYLAPAEVAAEAKPVPPVMPPKEKGPILPKHQVLQDIFEDLRRQCQQVATNPQMKRKLDDVAKKMENLYDKLRDDSLSPSVTHGLHQIVQSVMQGDYLSALGIHGQLVASANFTEISGFMPSLKVLLQTAVQLNVCLH